MKRSTLSIACYYALLASTFVKADAEVVTAPPIPAGCETYTGKYAENGGLRCRVATYVTSHDGKQFGPWVRLTMTAPKGYALRFSEGHVWAGDHKCGVRDEGASAPEWPSPLNVDHQREGEAHYAQCIIRERNDNHIVIEFRAQGVEGQSCFGGLCSATRDYSVNGGAEIIAFFNPIAAT